jgi:monoamine oxidase
MPEPIDLLDVLKGGLSRPGKARSVVIVGAGIAGLTAGMLLKEAGHEVTILEARNRLGGRIYTYRGFAGKMYGEFAAMAYSMLDEGQRIAQALEDLAKIHPVAKDTFEFGISHDWALDRHGGGIGPLFRPFEMTSKVFDDITRPVHRLWFAGDACSRLSRRWIEGAISSGVLNAYAINAGLRNELPPVASAQPI